MAPRNKNTGPKGSKRTKGESAKAEKLPRPIDKHGRLSVLIELRGEPGSSLAQAMSTANAMSVPGLKIDHEFAPVPMSGDGQGMNSAPTYVIRGTVNDEAEIEKLREHPEVAAIWNDAPIDKFNANDMGHVRLAKNPAFAPCPIGTCDCSPDKPKGTLADVAKYLGVDRIWDAGFRGAGIVVGIVDGGVTAVGRPVQKGETSRRIPRVIGGWPADSWGTETSKWREHGNMCATDVLGIAPEAQLYDLRIAGSGQSAGTISRALQAFQWAID